MKGARHIGWVAGIPVRIHWSFFLVIAWSAHIGYRAGGWTAVLFSVTLTLILFLCVFLHELGHALAARRFGVRTRSITLLPIGGVAALERIPERPLEELVIALAGPLVNVVIAGLLFMAGGWSGDVMHYGPLWDFGHLLEMVLFVNIFMVVFNMIPAFPMDGGRVLRACLACFVSYPRATSVAAAIGQVLAAGMIVTGLGTNPFLSLIGVMVFFGARVETRLVHLRSALAGLAVRDIMIVSPPSVQADEPLRHCLDAWHETGASDFIVMQGPRVVGLLPGGLWHRFLRDPDHGVRAGTVMERPRVMVRPGLSLVALMDLVRSEGQSIYPVMEDGALVGMVTGRHITSIMKSGVRPEGVAETPATGKVHTPARSWMDVG